MTFKTVCYSCGNDREVMCDIREGQYVEYDVVICPECHCSKQFY